MNSYPENEQVSFEIQVVDATGKPYEEACKATYSLFDAKGKELFSGNNDNVTSTINIVVVAQHNKLAEKSTKDIRKLVVKFMKSDDSLISAVSTPYFIYSKTPLVVGQNSFVTYEEYLLIASMTPHLDNFEGATKDQVVVALQEARDRLCRLRYRISANQYRQENVGYVSEVAWRPRAITDDDPLGLSLLRFSLDDVTTEEFSTMPEKFRNAVAKAQVIEANAVLAPTDSIEDKRRRGLILETVHEVKQMFSNVRPVNEKITSEAMKVLAPYLDTTMRIGRA